MKKLKEKLRNLYSVHDTEDKAIGLILAKNPVEAKKIWCNPENHELIFATKTQTLKVRFKEIKKAFTPNIFSRLLSERRIKPRQSLLCTKLARYYHL
jgi:hypothetical protein